MTIEGGTAIVLAYVLVSMGVIIAFLLAVFVIGWLSVGRASAAANSAENSNLRGKLSCAGQGRASPYGRARG